MKMKCLACAKVNKDVQWIVGDDSQHDRMYPDEESRLRCLELNEIQIIGGEDLFS